MIGEAVLDGATVLLSSHEPELSIPLSDRVLTMAGGRITAEGAGGRGAAAAAGPTLARVHGGIKCPRRILR